MVLPHVHLSLHLLLHTFPLQPFFLHHLFNLYMHLPLVSHRQPLALLHILSSSTSVCSPLLHLFLHFLFHHLFPLHNLLLNLCILILFHLCLQSPTPSLPAPPFPSLVSPPQPLAKPLHINPLPPLSAVPYSSSSCTSSSITSPPQPLALLRKLTLLHHCL